MSRKRAFTMIELLTVIAIIAILAAIIFPVYSRAKASAFRNGDIANMNAIRSAVQLYRADQGGYPPALLGFVTTYTPGGTDTIPADKTKGFLFPRRVSSVASFKPALLTAGMLDTTKAVYPTQDNRAIGTAPILDLNGDGQISLLDDIAGARQAYGPTDGNVCPGWTVGCQPNLELNYYKISGYDVATVPEGTSATRVELRYAPFWSDFSVNGNGNAQDDPRQLGYADPPDNTLITWDSFFRDNDDNGVPEQNRSEIVLFLGGSARSFDSKTVYDRSWRVLP